MTSKTAQIISANDLLDGNVIYLASEGTWTSAMSEAVLIFDNENADSLLTKAKAQSAKVIDPYLLEVRPGPGLVRPAHIREQLRDSGPSIRPDLQRNPWQPTD